MEIKRVAVIGAGAMGHGIAEVVSLAGMEALLNDIKEEILQKALSAISTSLERMVKKEKISFEDSKAVLARIHLTTNLAGAVRDSDLVIEAIPENLEIKKTMFRKLEELTGPRTILASNTSQYSITEIASAVSNSWRVIGMHWFNPPVVMKLIEIVKGLETADGVVEQVKDFTRKVGKEAVVCKDSQGFISTRVLMALRLECYRILEEDVATKEDIDKTLKLALGHPMGQFELADFSGLDIEIPACEAMVKIYGDRFRPPQNLIHLVRAGRFGRKTGRGWYDYNV
jgi:3-hydroxybutyryl-CoA dehydrogenase